MARRRKWLWIGLALVVLIGMGLFVRWLADRGPAPALIISHQTTWITEPLNKDGTVNYVAYVDALARQGVTAENNAAIKYLQAVGPQGLKQDNPAAAERVLQALNLKLPPDRTYFVPLDDFIAKQSGKTGKDLSKAKDDANGQAAGALKKPWTAADYPLLDQWVTANEASLDLLVEASKLEKFYVPPVSDSDPPSMSDAWTRLNLSKMTGLTKCLAARAARSVAAGRLDAAWVDAHALYRLGRLLQALKQDKIQMLCGQNVEGWADDAAGLIVAHDSLSSTQAVAMLKALLELREPDPAAKSIIESDRLSTLDLLQRSWRPEQLPNGFDGNYPMTLLNRYADACLAAITAGDYMAVMRELKKADAEAAAPLTYWQEHKTRLAVEGFVAGRRWLGRVTAEMCVGMCTPDHSSIYRHEIGSHARTELTTVALALAAYRADTGQFPDSLAAIAPKYLPRLPDDPYTAKPLLYRREADGGCTVYSVGEDMKDDGGVDGKDIPVHLGPKQK